MELHHILGQLWISWKIVLPDLLLAKRSIQLTFIKGFLFHAMISHEIKTKNPIFYFIQSREKQGIRQCSINSMMIGMRKRKCVWIKYLLSFGCPFFMQKASVHRNSLPRQTNKSSKHLQWQCDEFVADGLQFQLVNYQDVCDACCTVGSGAELTSEL